MNVENFEINNFKVENFKKLELKKVENITKEDFKKFEADKKRFFKEDGQRIKNVVSECGYTTADLGDKGLNMVYLVMIYKGYIKATKKDCETIAEAIGEPHLANYLFTGKT